MKTRSGAKTVRNLINFRMDFRQQSEQFAIQSYRGLPRDFRTRFLKICDEAGVKKSSNRS